MMNDENCDPVVVNSIKDVIDDSISCNGGNVSQTDTKDEDYDYNIETDKIRSENTNQSDAAKHLEVNTQKSISEDDNNSTNNKLTIGSYQEQNIAKNKRDKDISITTSISKKTVTSCYQDGDNLNHISSDLTNHDDVKVNGASIYLKESSKTFDEIDVGETIRNNENKENNTVYNAKDNSNNNYSSNQEKQNVYSEDSTKTIVIEEVPNTNKEVANKITEKSKNNCSSNQEKHYSENSVKTILIEEVLKANKKVVNDITEKCNINYSSNQEKQNVYSEDSTKTIKTEEVPNTNKEVVNKITEKSNNNCSSYQEKQNIYSENSTKTIVIEEIINTNMEIVNKITEKCNSVAEMNGHQSSNQINEIDQYIIQNNVEEKCVAETKYATVEYTPIIVNSKEILEASAKILVPAVKLELVTVYQCHRCSNVFLSQLQLHNHIIMRHTHEASVCLENTNIYVCDHYECTRGFLNSYDYKIHIHSHRQETVKRSMFLEVEDNKMLKKNFQCDECDQKFVLESTLEAHSVLHKPMKHQCHCGVGFYLHKDLVSHKAVVHPSSNDKNKKPVWKPKIKLFKNEPFDPKINKSKSKRKRVVHRIKIKKDNGTKSLHKSTEELERLRAIIPDKDNRYHCPDCTTTFVSTAGLVRHYAKHSTEPRPYACNLCDKTFTQQGAADLHMKRHSNVKDYVCQVCDKGFFSKHNLILHTRTHTGERPLACSFCPRRFADPSALRRHLRTHTGDKIYQCESCPKRFSDVSALIVHRKRHKNQRDHKCDLCQKAFYLLGDLRNHRKVHFTDKNYQCNHCQKRFQRKQYLDIHRNVHFSNKNYQCSQCQKRFQRKQYLDSHIKLVHESDGQRFECDLCGRTYVNKYYLIFHLKEHYNTVYHCSICGKKLFCESEFEEHKKICQKKAFPCNICDKVYKREYCCKEHIMTHLEPRYECHDCCKKFHSKSSLCSHISHLHMERKHKCDRCEKKFVTFGDYYDHINQMCERKKYKCRICEIIFDFREQFEKHKLKHHSSKYICDFCKKKFSTKTSLSRHIAALVCNGKNKACGPYYPYKNVI